MMRRWIVPHGLAATACPSMPAVAQPGKARTLRLVPRSNLPTLDPVSSSEVVANHGFHVFDRFAEFETNLRRLRDEEKLGPAAIARRLGINRASVCRLLGTHKQTA